MKQEQVEHLILLSINKYEEILPRVKDKTIGVAKCIFELNGLKYDFLRFISNYISEKELYEFKDFVTKYHQVYEKSWVTSPHLCTSIEELVSGMETVISKLKFILKEIKEDNKF